MKYLSLFWIFLILLGLGCKKEEQSKPIVLGAIYNLTGGQASLDIPSSKGAQLAIQQANEAGGVHDQMLELLLKDGDDLDLTDQGRTFAGTFGIDVGTLGKARRPLCKSCLDWSARRTHLAGYLGTAFLDRFYDLGWAKRQDQSRVVTFSATGESRFLANFPI